MTKEDEEKISNALHDVWGIRNVTIKPTQQQVTISYNENSGAAHDFEQALTDLGFEVSSDNIN